MVWATQGVAAETMPERFERPEAFRFAINAVIGDISYLVAYGQLPGPAVAADHRVRVHLEYVHSLLSHRDVTHLTPQQKQNRSKHLQHLRRYIDAGEFPKNRFYTDQNRPCFIDDKGRICAVGYLVETSAGRDVAEAINDKFQSAFLWRMTGDVLSAWVESSGFSMLELCMIQPGYAPEFHLAVETESSVAPAIVTIRGRVLDIGNVNGPLTRVVTIDFSDGSTWTSAVYEPPAYIVPVDVEHVLVSPGTHTITVRAFAYYGAWEAEEWELTIAPPSFTINKVETGINTNEVYLTTADDIRMPYLTSAQVDWGDGSATGAGWFIENGVFRTQTHQYAQSGPRVVTVTNSYLGQFDSHTESTSATINVGALPVAQTSWGRIKAIYSVQ